MTHSWLEEQQIDTSKDELTLLSQARSFVMDDWHIG